MVKTQEKKYLSVLSKDEDGIIGGGILYFNPSFADKVVNRENRYTFDLSENSYDWFFVQGNVDEYWDYVWFEPSSLHNEIQSAERDLLKLLFMLKQ